MTRVLFRATMLTYKRMIFSKSYTSKNHSKVDKGVTGPRETEYALFIVKFR